MVAGARNLRQSVNGDRAAKAMTKAKKRANGKTAERPAARLRPAKPQNPQINLQTRKVLKQHYRAKYGVK